MLVTIKHLFTSLFELQITALALAVMCSYVHNQKMGGGGDFFEMYQAAGKGKRKVVK